eukprot:786031-Pleurochrysis_carterae.AAC.1
MHQSSSASLRLCAFMKAVRSPPRHNRCRSAYLYCKSAAFFRTRSRYYLALALAARSVCGQHIAPRTFLYQASFT